jgi:hypothetical protein
MGSFCKIARRVPGSFGEKIFSSPATRHPPPEPGFVRGTCLAGAPPAPSARGSSTAIWVRSVTPRGGRWVRSGRRDLFPPPAAKSRPRRIWSDRSGYQGTRREGPSSKIGWAAETVPG